MRKSANHTRIELITEAKTLFTASVEIVATVVSLIGLAIINS